MNSVDENVSAPSDNVLPTVDNEAEDVCDWHNELGDDFLNYSTETEAVVNDQNLIFVQSLAQWKAKHLITRDAMNDLLVILRESNPELKVPKDARTVLKTPKQKTIIIQDQTGGQYWHYGLKKSLIACLNDSQYPSVSINVSIDGLPIFESSRVEFWPILINIHEKNKIPPMIIGIYSGKGITFIYSISLVCAIQICDFILRKTKGYELVSDSICRRVQ